MGWLMGWREGGFNFGESYGFKTLHFENQEPQMNPCERRFIVTGNTDDTDFTDFHGYEIRAYPFDLCNPCSIGRRRTFITSQILKSGAVPEAATFFNPK